MRRQIGEALVADLVLERQPRDVHGHRRAVLEAARPDRQRVHDEQVATEGKPSEHPAGRGGDAAQDVDQAGAVRVATAVERQLEARPPDGERAGLVRADLERGIHQLVEVRGGVCRAPHGAQRGRHPPARARRRRHPHAARSFQLAVDVEEHAGSVPVGVAVVEERRAHAGLEREHPVADHEPAPARADPPPLLVQALAWERPAARVADGQPEDVADEVAHQIAARGPGREHDLDDVALAQRRDAHLHFELVRRGLGHRDPVLDRPLRGNTCGHGWAG